jgi:hypothetical protein
VGGKEGGGGEGGEEEEDMPLVCAAISLLHSTTSSLFRMAPGLPPNFFRRFFKSVAFIVESFWDATASRSVCVSETEEREETEMCLRTSGVKARVGW